MNTPVGFACQTQACISECHGMPGKCPGIGPSKRVPKRLGTTGFGPGSVGPYAYSHSTATRRNLSPLGTYSSASGCDSSSAGFANSAGLMRWETHPPGWARHAVRRHDVAVVQCCLYVVVLGRRGADTGQCATLAGFRAGRHRHCNADRSHHKHDRENPEFLGHRSPSPQLDRRSLRLSQSRSEREHTLLCSDACQLHRRPDFGGVLAASLGETQ